MPAKADVKTRLDFLQSLESGQVVSQSTLSQRVGASVGLVNALLKRAVTKGFVKVKAAPAKRFAYYLTPKGFSEKGRLVVAYLDHSLSFFREAREAYVEIFRRAEQTPGRRCVLVGGGELAEIAQLAALETGIEIVAILDRETNRERVGRLPVLREVPEASSFDWAVLTDMRDPQATYDRTVENVRREIILVPEFLRIAGPGIRKNARGGGA
jgi:hypothetical protein